jgi:hypothetical protein
MCKQEMEATEQQQSTNNDVDVDAHFLELWMAISSDLLGALRIKSVGFIGCWE